MHHHFIGQSSRIVRRKWGVQVGGCHALECCQGPASVDLVGGGGKCYLKW